MIKILPLHLIEYDASEVFYPDVSHDKTAPHLG